jgi:hypothetical protein
VESKTQKHLLESAVRELGRRPLATALNVPLGILDDWVAGTPMPEPKFLAVVAQLLNELDRRELHG